MASGSSNLMAVSYDSGRASRKQTAVNNKPHRQSHRMRRLIMTSPPANRRTIGASTSRYELTSVGRVENMTTFARVRSGGRHQGPARKSKVRAEHSVTGYACTPAYESSHAMIRRPPDRG